MPKDTYPNGYRVTVQGRNAKWDGHGVTVSTHGRSGTTYQVAISPR